MRIWSLRLSLFLALWPFWSAGQEVAVLTMKDGLSSNQVYACAQDAQGYLWVATHTHLCRYDGSGFLSRRNSKAPAFQQEWPAGIVNIAAKGNLIYVGDQQQIVLVDALSGRVEAIDVSEEVPAADYLAPGYALKSSKGDIYVLFNSEDKHTIVALRLEKNKVASKTILQNVFAASGQYYYTVAVDGGGAIYALDRACRHIVRFDAEGRMLGQVPAPGEGRLVLQVNPADELMVQQGWQQVYVADSTLSGFRPHPVSAHLQQVPFYVKYLSPAPDGTLWLVSPDNNIAHYDPANEQFQTLGATLAAAVSNRWTVNSIFVDWGGTLMVNSDLGVVRVRPSASLFDTYFTAPLEACQGRCSFRGFAEDDAGNVYASFYNNIFKIDAAGRADTLKVSKRDILPFDLGYRQGQLILNTGQYLDLASGEATAFPFQVEHDFGALAYDADSVLWLAYVDRFYTAPAGTWQARGKTISGEFIYDLAFDPHSQLLWAVSNFGILSIDPRSGEQVRHAGPKFGVKGRFNCLYPDGRGAIWVGADVGLLRFLPATGDWLRLSSAEGLANDVVAGILPEGDSCLWVSTYQGLSRYHIPSNSFQNYYKNDGLADNEFNRASFFKASDGRLYFGGTRGITAFYPQELVRADMARSSSARLLLQSIAITEQTDSVTMLSFWDAEESLHLYHRNKTISISFGLINANGEGSPSFSYLVEGLTNQWSPSLKEGNVTLSNLPSGTYLFRAIAKDGQGRWIPGELNIRLVVHPPWWRSYWAYLVYAMLAVLAGMGIYRFFKQRWQLEQQLLLEERETLRLKELDTFKSRLYANITHEFRTPLTVILGMGEALKPLVGPAGSAKLRAIEQNGQGLLKLINQLLDLSKLESGAFRLKPQDGDVVQHVRYVVESFSAAANGQNLALRLESDVARLPMHFDAEQLQHVLANLLSNALKFTPSGGSIRVAIGREAGPGMGWVSIGVSDTGIGIAAESLPHIFDRFFQVDASSRRSGEGTGIGLAHAKELVQLMGGHIAVSSRPQQGSTFTVKLPIVPIRGAAPLAPPAPMLPAVPPKPSQNTPRAARRGADSPQILIIEDNAHIIDYLKTLLQGDYSVSVAVNGRFGVEAALEHIPDLIICDIMMPVMNGYEVLECLKADQRSSHIPILLLTAKADSDARLKGLRRGADAYLTKPFEQQEFFATLQMLLDNKQRIRAHFRAAAEAGADSLPAHPPALQESIAIEDEFLKNVRRIIAEHYHDEHFGLPQLCQRVGISRYQLFRKLKALTDSSPSDMIRQYRMQQAQALLREGQLSVKEVAFRVGFKDVPHFSRTYQASFGITPGATSN